MHAVLAPVSTSGTALSIRIPRVRAADLEALAALGAFDAHQQSWLLGLVAERANVLITGGTGTGKTTLLSALLSEVSPTERIVTIEDVAEAVLSVALLARFKLQTSCYQEFIGAYQMLAG